MYEGELQSFGGDGDGERSTVGAHGQGKLTYLDNMVFEGRWENGEMQAVESPDNTSQQFGHMFGKLTKCTWKNAHLKLG